jgi:hypothetical protein
MAMGQAAGQAAKQVVRTGIAFHEADMDILRQELRENGGIVDIDGLPD